jgi:hypothetical protein
MHERLRTDDRDDLQDQRKPSIQLDEEPAIVVRKRLDPGAATFAFMFEGLVERIFQIDLRSQAEAISASLAAK